MNIGQRVFATVEDEQNLIYKEIMIPKILTTQSEENMAKMQVSAHWEFSFLVDFNILSFYDYVFLLRYVLAKF